VKRKYRNLTTDDHKSFLAGTPSSRHESASKQKASLHFFGCVYLFERYSLGDDLENTQLIFQKEAFNVVFVYLKHILLDDDQFKGIDIFS